MGVFHSKTAVVFMGSAPSRFDTGPTAKCDYCGRYGTVGACEGCGAPNVPVEQERQIDVTCFGDAKPRFIEGY